MYYLIPIPFITTAVIIKLIADNNKLKLFSILSNLIIIVGLVAFAYLYASYNGYDVMLEIKKFLGI